MRWRLLFVEFVKEIIRQRIEKIVPHPDLPNSGSRYSVLPMTLSLDRLKKIDRVELTCDVHCVTGWSLLDIRWEGIPLTALMALAKVRTHAGFVIFESPEDYTANIPMAEARKANVILADTFQGTPLPMAHGAPLRALVPDLYFWKSAKWVEGIRFTVEDEPGFYESGGYSNTADPWKEERFEGEE